MNKERTMIYRALNLHVNYIETGFVEGLTRSRILDLARTDKDMLRSARSLPWLSDSQKEGVQEIRDLMSKVINGEDL